MDICKFSPDTMEFFQEAAIRSWQLQEYDRVKLISTPSQDRSANSVANRIINVLDDRRDYRGRAIMQGSFTRETNLAKPGLSDVDILCFIDEDYSEYPLRSIDEFEEVRKCATRSIKDHLMDNLQDCFAAVELEEDWPGLCIKLRVKTHWSARNFWSVDVIFAYEATGIETFFEELEDMGIAKKARNTNAISVLRNSFVEDIHENAPRLRILVRLLKCFKWISMRETDRDCVKAVNSFVLEVLVLILYSKGTIPEDFALNRALCTCLEHIGYPGSRDVWISVDASGMRLEPSDWDLEQMRRNCGEDGLIVVDPLAPFSNIAVRKQRNNQAWAALTEDAQDLYHHLKRNGVAPYQ